MLFQLLSIVHIKYQLGVVCVRSYIVKRQNCELMSGSDFYHAIIYFSHAKDKIYDLLDFFVFAI